MRLRTWLSIITLGLIALVLFLARQEIIQAVHLLTKVDLAILWLTIPVLLIGLYATGEMMFSYLRQKDSIAHVSPLRLIRLSLEMNFVNHILPSGGVSGLSYMGWRMTKLGVSPGRSAMAQVVRYTAQFVSFVLLLVLAVLMVTIDGALNRWIILTSCVLVFVMVSTLVVVAYVISSRRRIAKFSSFITDTVNIVVRKVTFGKRQFTTSYLRIDNALEDLHKDFVVLRREKKLILTPILWGIVANLADVALFFVAFWAMGVTPNPAPILIAYGVASIAGLIVVTPGGAGAYEAIMVAFLGVAGISHGTALAGVLLARMIMLTFTIAIGYFFYQHAIIKYGKRKNPSRR